MKSFQEHIVTMYQSYHEGNDPYDIGDLVYNWMKEVKIAVPNQTEIHEAMIYATEKMRDYKAEKLKEKTKFSFEDEKSEENMKKKFARSYIRNKIFDKYPLSTLISKISIEQFKK
jgi:hypothetical protein